MVIIVGEAFHRVVAAVASRLLLSTIVNKEIGNSKTNKMYNICENKASEIISNFIISINNIAST